MDELRQLIDLAGSRGWTVGSAESLTAGLFCAQIASCPGASVVLKGGIVTYWTEMKEVLLDVPAMLVEKFGVISRECARHGFKRAADHGCRLCGIVYGQCRTGCHGREAGRTRILRDRKTGWNSF